MLHGLRQFGEDYSMATLYICYLGTETLYLDNNITAIPFVDALKKLPVLFGSKSDAWTVCFFVKNEVIQAVISDRKIYYNDNRSKKEHYWKNQKIEITRRNKGRDMMGLPIGYEDFGALIESGFRPFFAVFFYILHSVAGKVAAKRKSAEFRRDPWRPITETLGDDEEETDRNR